MSQPVTLAADGWKAVLLPEVGGSIASLLHDREDILRPALSGSDDPLQMASFPLVPYANRIAYGRFVSSGRTIVLPRNFGDHPHPLHGTGWLAPWQVEAQAAGGATLSLTHCADESWPWDFAAEQRFTIAAEGLSVRLSVRNEADRPMPAGLGFHPYFPAPAGATLRARLAGAWLADDTHLPTERVSASHFGDWSGGDGVARREPVDHCHDGWDGEATIESGGRTIHLRAEGTRWLHLYMPPGEGFFCAEPVSHLPDGVNREDAGIALLSRGETKAITMRIGIG